MREGGPAADFYVGFFVCVRACMYDRLDQNMTTREIERKKRRAC